MSRKIEHLECSCCKVKLTRLEEGEIEYDTHFDLIRAKKVFVFNPNEGTVDEDPTYANEKMRQVFCKDCFTKILNESPTLHKLFFNIEKGVYFW